MNTKARHREIYNAAALALEEAGGIKVIDGLVADKRVFELRRMALDVASATRCHRETARRNVAKAMRRARYKITKDNWGGQRTNQVGRPPLPQAEKRQKVSTRLGPGYKELAQAIAEVEGLPGWGHAVEQALIRMVEGDRELKIKLAEMGIIIRGNDGKRTRLF